MLRCIFKVDAIARRRDADASLLSKLRVSVGAAKTE